MSEDNSEEMYVCSVCKKLLEPDYEQWICNFCMNYDSYAYKNAIQNESDNDNE